MFRTFAAMMSDDAGAVLVEYAIVAAAIAIPILVAATAICTGAGTALSSTSGGIESLNQSPP